MMIETPDIQRPPKEIIEALYNISAATAAGELHRLGIRNPHILGPVTFSPG
ncbi:MAG: ribonuclease activity regulator RraA, partial [Chloroflexi bacterium]|nr:ribonuclease activity regulator RraA [Chloroflexota bacterium]